MRILAPCRSVRPLTDLGSLLFFPSGFALHSGAAGLLLSPTALTRSPGLSLPFIVEEPRHLFRFQGYKLFFCSGVTAKKYGLTAVPNV